MKSKKNVYVLLAAVIFIWGVVLFKVFAAFHSSEVVIIKKSKTTQFIPEKIKPRERKELNANYRDPFLGTFISEKKEQKITAVVDKTPLEEIEFPMVEYKGNFSGSNKSDMVFLLTINGVREMFKLKETHQEVKLLHGDKVKVVVKYRTEKRTIQLQQ